MIDPYTQRDPAGPDDTHARVPSRRRLARIAAVQALYQADVTGKPVPDVLREFNRYQIGRDIDGFVMNADKAFFNRLVRGTDERREDLERVVRASLTTGREFDHLEIVLRAILLAGAFELTVLTDVPPRVSIDEYVDIADDFFGRNEAGLVNGVLDRIAKVVRPDEVG